MRSARRCRGASRRRRASAPGSASEPSYQIANPVQHHNHLTGAENLLAYLEQEHPLGIPIEMDDFGFRQIRFVPPEPKAQGAARPRARSRSRSPG